MTELNAKLINPDYEPESATERRQIETFATLIAGIWFNTQAAYDQGQIDENSYQVYCEDVVVRLAQWPALKPYFKQIMEGYPSAKDKPIYLPLYD